MADGSIGSRALAALAGTPAVNGLWTTSLLLRRTTALLLRRTTALLLRRHLE